MSTDTPRVSQVRSALSLGYRLMVLGTVLAVADCLFNYFWPGNGIHGTWGALGVLCGSFLIFLVSLWLGFGLRRLYWLRLIIHLALLIALVADGFCAWLLETKVLEAFVALTILGWLVALAGIARPARAERRVAP